MYHYKHLCLSLVISCLFLQPILMAIDEVIVNTTDGASISIPRQELTLSRTLSDFISTEKLISSGENPDVNTPLIPLQEFDLTSNEALQEIDLTSNEEFSAAFYEVKAYLDELYNFYIERAQIDLPPGAPIIDDHFDRVRGKNRLEAISLLMKKIPEDVSLDITLFKDLLYAADHLVIRELIEACIIPIINRKDLQRSDMFVQLLLASFADIQAEFHGKQVEWRMLETDSIFHPAFAKNSLILDFDQAIFINSLHRERAPAPFIITRTLLSWGFSHPVLIRTMYNILLPFTEEKTWIYATTNVFAHLITFLLGRLIFKLNLSSRYPYVRESEEFKVQVPPPLIFEPFFKNTFKKFTPAQQRDLSKNFNFKFLPSNTGRFNICNQLLICGYLMLEWYLYMLFFDDIHTLKLIEGDRHKRIKTAPIVFLLSISSVGLIRFMEKQNPSLNKLIDDIYDRFLRGFFGDEKIEALIPISHNHED